MMKRSNDSGTFTAAGRTSKNYHSLRFAYCFFKRIPCIPDQSQLIKISNYFSVIKILL